MRLTREQAQAIVEEIGYGQTDRVTIGHRAGLTLDEANSDDFRDILEGLFRIMDREDNQRASEENGVS